MAAKKTEKSFAQKQAEAKVRNQKVAKEVSNMGVLGEIKKKKR